MSSVMRGIYMMISLTDIHTAHIPIHSHALTRTHNRREAEMSTRINAKSGEKKIVEHQQK